MLLPIWLGNYYTAIDLVAIVRIGAKELIIAKVKFRMRFEMGESRCKRVKRTAGPPLASYLSFE